MKSGKFKALCHYIPAVFIIFVGKVILFINRVFVVQNSFI